MSETVDLTPKKELTPEQIEYWKEQLILAERKVEYARRMLGMKAIQHED